MIINTLEKVILTLGSRYLISDKKVYQFIKSNNLNDDLIADILGYYGIENKKEGE